MKSDNVQGSNQEQSRINENTAGYRNDFNKNHCGSITAASTLNNTEKHKYVIKDIPELTLANFFQNKNV